MENASDKTEMIVLDEMRRTILPWLIQDEIHLRVIKQYVFLGELRENSSANMVN